MPLVAAPTEEYDGSKWEGLGPSDLNNFRTEDDEERRVRCVCVGGGGGDVVCLGVHGSVGVVCMCGMCGVGRCVTDFTFHSS